MRQETSSEGRLPIVVDIDAGRRAFMQSIGLAAAGAALLGGTLGSATEAEAAAPLTDVNILNFALNLEYLEAEFYLRAARGRGLFDADTTGTGTLGPVTGGRKVDFDTDLIYQYALEISLDEQSHVKFLRKALGSARVARPRIDLNTSFTAAARAAGIIGPGETFDPFANENNFLLGAFIFEDVGVTAYKGAARFLQNKDYLEAAAGILAVEAYHAGEIRTILVSRGLMDPAKKISDLRDAVDGPTDDDQPIWTGPKSLANIIPADDNGIAFSRSPDQVLKIVYLGGTARGGFFPVGLNGAIRTAS